ncbi:MAG: pseudouridine synthase, partial [Planctomycetota bacterium]
LMTNDGDLTHRLTHPSFGVTKRYLVSVRGRLIEDDLQKLRKGLILTDQKAEPAEGARPTKRAAMESVKILRHETDRTRGDRTTLGVTLTEGQNREIRRLLARVGIKVRRLKRTALGPVRLKGLAPGEWRMLSNQEVWALRRAVGIKQKKPS